MTRKKKVLLTTLSLFLLLIISGALYANYWLNNLVAELNTPTNSVTDNIKAKDEYPEKPTAKENDMAVHLSPKEDIQEQPTTTQENNQPSQKLTTDSKNQSTDKPKPKEDNNTPQPPPTNTEIVGSVQEQIDKPIEKGDLLEAGLIVISKLNPDEINFMFGFADKSYTKEELIEVRRVLLSKLNDEDIQTLRTLGQKYGKKLDILDPNVPIN